MSETKPDYKIDPVVAQASLKEQMRAIHDLFDDQPRPGEFTMGDYRNANPSPGSKRMSYERGKRELEEAESAGIVARRVVRGRVYFRFVTGG